MLPNLLAERFKLTLHREKREPPVYALMVAKNGPKMKVSQADPDAGGTWGAWNDNARWVAPNETMPDFADFFLSPRLDRPVIDMAGLTAKYDVTLAAEPAPTVFAAVQEQLGLKLERGTGPMDMLAIDHAEKTPTEN
jgi:uncharacterized protein (TIGR03435 family)